MEKREIVNKQFTLKVRDFVKGLLLSVFAGVIAVVYESVQAGSLDFNLEAIKLAAVTAFIGYLIKNLIEPTKTVTITKE